ncbi:SRPBCC family protein [soil metagenome]
METSEKTVINIETTINAPVEKVWKYWNEPEHITKWCQASDDWHAPYAENDVRVDGRFKTIMAAKDGSFSFDFSGYYTNVREHEIIEYTLDDDRKVKINFSDDGKETKVIQSFEAESSHSIDMQRNGWQAILDNFKKYTETN